MTNGKVIRTVIQTAVAENESSYWQNSESDRERMLFDCQSWVLETTGTEHSPPAATVLVVTILAEVLLFYLDFIGKHVHFIFRICMIALCHCTVSAV